MDMFRYLKVGLSFVLCFVGVKMMLVDFYKIPIGVSLAVIAGILAISIFASLLRQRKAAGLPAARLIPASGLAKGRGMRTQINVWVCLAVVVVVLAIVKLTSVSTGPSADEAVVAIRVAQHDILQARTGPLKENYPELTGADAELTLALSALKEKRYEEAILAARRAIELIRKRAA